MSKSGSLQQQLLVLLFVCLMSITNTAWSLPELRVSDSRTPLRRRDLKPATPSAKVDGKGKEYVVTLGQDQFAFRPTQQNASIGDFITFMFYPKEHSAVLGDFDNACSPWGYVHPNDNDTWSGLINTTVVKSPLTQWTYEVTTDEPRFFYCSAPGSCTQQGMVFALNPNATQTFETYYKAALNSKYQISPGENPPSENGATGSTPTQTATQTQVVQATSAGNSNNNHSGLSTGAIVGIAIGGIAAVALVGILFFLIGRGGKKEPEKNTNSEATDPGTNQPIMKYTDQPSHPPPGYDGRAFSPPLPGVTPSPQMTQGEWNDASKPPLSPGMLAHRHDSMHTASSGIGQGASPRPGYNSWAPSELSAPLPVVEIYTPGPDERPISREGR